MYQQPYDTQALQSTVNSTATFNPISELTDIRLSLGARILLSLIKRWSGKKGYCWWSIDGIGGKVDRCTRTVQRWKRELLDAGVLQRIECRGHSDYLIPYPSTFAADLRQFMDGSQTPRQARYDPYSWTPPPPSPEQANLEIPLPEPLREAEGVTFSSGVIEKMEAGQDALPSAPAPASFLQEQEKPQQKDLFTNEIDETTIKGWMLVFSPQDPDTMLRCISHCTGKAIEAVRSAWDSFRQKRKGAFLRDIAVEFIKEVMNGFGRGTLTTRASP